MKRLITKLKIYIRKFFRKLVMKNYPDPMTDEEVFEGLFDWICKNRPNYFNDVCMCGCFMSHKNIDIQFHQDFVWLIYKCPKCFLSTEKRYSYEMDLIKD